MSLKNLIVGMTSVIMLCACAPAAQQSAQHDHQDMSSAVATHKTETLKKDHTHRATVKPGADVTIKSVLPKFMRSGAFQTVQLELKDGYKGGVMTVSIEPSEGLTLFGGSNSKTFDMANPGPHIWDVDVKADNDGVYFLNVFAMTQGLHRTSSIQVNVGTVTQKMFNDAMPADGELTDDANSSDGGKIRVLEATETIQ